MSVTFIIKILYKLKKKVFQNNFINFNKLILQKY